MEGTRKFETVDIGIARAMAGWVAADSRRASGSTVDKHFKLTEAVSADNGPKERKVAKPKLSPIRRRVRVGRNELCPCGSGLKFKRCHGLKT